MLAFLPSFLLPGTQLQQTSCTPSLLLALQMAGHLPGVHKSQDGLKNSTLGKSWIEKPNSPTEAEREISRGSSRRRSIVTAWRASRKDSQGRRALLEQAGRWVCKKLTCLGSCSTNPNVLWSYFHLTFLHQMASLSMETAGPSVNFFIFCCLHP